MESRASIPIIKLYPALPGFSLPTAGYKRDNGCVGVLIRDSKWSLKPKGSVCVPTRVCVHAHISSAILQEP